MTSMSSCCRSACSQEFAPTGTTGPNGDRARQRPHRDHHADDLLGKGFGDLPIGYLRPFALTGTLGYTIANTSLKVTGTDPDTGAAVFNNGTSNQWNGGLSLQYSMRYLQSQVKDFGFPEFVNKLTPVVELSWSSPASKPNQDARSTYSASASITPPAGGARRRNADPRQQADRSHMGVIAQFHLYFDDLFPHSLGKPIVDWFH